MDKKCAKEKQHRVKVLLGDLIKNSFLKLFDSTKLLDSIARCASGRGSYIALADE